MQERPSLEQLADKRVALSQARAERGQFLLTIGTGEVRPEDSWESAIEIGRTKRAVRSAIQGLDASLTALDRACEERTPEYLSLLRTRTEQMDEIRTLVAEGNLPETVVRQYAAQLTRLRMLPFILPGLRRGLDAVPQLPARIESPIPLGPATPVIVETAPITPVAADQAAPEGEAAPTLDRIPDLLDQLGHIESVHQHKYNAGITVAAQLAEADAIDPEHRTPEQARLVRDVAEFSRFARNTDYQNVYTPEELHELVKQFRKAAQRNRPDFNEVERKIVDTLSHKMERDGVGNNERLTDGVRRRLHQERDKRRGMNWESLTTLAQEAGDFIAESANSQRELRGYMVEVWDPEPQRVPNLTTVYQFIANSHAYDMVGKRSIQADQMRQEVFVANCAVVEAWFAEVEPVLAELKEADKAAYGAMCFEIKDLVSTMRERLTGRATTGFSKAYYLDPAGAINLQKRLGYRVRDLKARMLPPEQTAIVADETEIIPL